MNRVQRSKVISEESGTTSTIKELYILNRTIYTRSDNKWNKSMISSPKDIINTKNVIYDDADLINTSEIKLLGFSEIDGEECYCIEVKPSIKSLYSIISNIGLSFSRDNASIEDLLKNGNFKWLSWITKQNHYLTMCDIKAEFNIKPDDLGYLPMDQESLNISTHVISKYGNYNVPIFINFSNEFKLAYPFPLNGDSATIYGVIQEDSTYDDNNIIYIDTAVSGHYNANLIDIDDRYYKSESDVNSGCRDFLKFEIPNGTIIKKIKFEPDNIYNNKGSPFSIDLRLDQLGFIRKNHINMSEFNGSDNGINLRIYSLNEEYDGYTSSEPLLVDLATDIKVTNSGQNEFSLDTDDFTLIDQFGWEYPATNNYELSGTLLPGESRRFDLVIPDVSILSDPVIFKYKNLRVDLR